MPENASCRYSSKKPFSWPSAKKPCDNFERTGRCHPDKRNLHAGTHVDRQENCSCARVAIRVSELAERCEAEGARRGSFDGSIRTGSAQFARGDTAQGRASEPLKVPETRSSYYRFVRGVRRDRAAYNTVPGAGRWAFSRCRPPGDRAPGPGLARISAGAWNARLDLHIGNSRHSHSQRGDVSWGW